MAKIDDIYDAVDDFGLITSAEAAGLGMSRAEVVQQASKGKLVRVARGVYRVPVWPSQPEAPYAIAVKAAGNGAFLYGESVVALLGLAVTNPSKIWVASPKRCRRDLGVGVIVKQVAGVKPVYVNGIACQPLPGAILASALTMGRQRALGVACRSFQQGRISWPELERIASELLR